MPNRYELETGQLHWTCNPQYFDFETTKELANLDEIVGQDRAVSALSSDIHIKSPGYHKKYPHSQSNNILIMMMCFP